MAYSGRNGEFFKIIKIPVELDKIGGVIFDKEGIFFNNINNSISEIKLVFFFLWQFFETNIIIEAFALQLQFVLFILI